MAKMCALQKTEFDAVYSDVVTDTIAILTEDGKKKFLRDVGITEDRMSNLSFMDYEVDQVEYSFVTVGFIVPVKALDRFVAVSYASILLDGSGTHKTLKEAWESVDKKMEEILESVGETPLTENRFLYRTLFDQFATCKDFSLEGIKEHIAAQGGPSTHIKVCFI